MNKEVLSERFQSVALGEMVEVLDHRRVPVNRKERATRVGSIPYYGATGQVDWIDDLIFDEKLVLLGEDGVQFLDPRVRKAYVVEGPSWVNNHAHVLRAREGMLPAFLCHALNAADYRDKVNGVTRLKLTKSSMLRLQLPLPSLQEQKRIVGALSAVETRLAEGRGAFARVQQELAVFKASLRLAACTGGLARASDDPGRSSTWDDVSLGELACDEPRAFTDGPFGSHLKSSHYTEAGPRVIRLANVGDGHFVDHKTHISQEHFASLRSHEVKAGDVVIGALGDLLPRACVLPEGVGPAIVKADCPRIRPRSDVNPHYLALALNSPVVRKQAEDKTHGLGRQRLNMKELKSLSIPIPPLDEQNAIVAVYDSAWSAATLLHERLAAGTENSAQLWVAALYAELHGSGQPVALALSNNGHAVQDGE